MTPQEQREWLFCLKLLVVLLAMLTVFNIVNVSLINHRITALEARLPAPATEKK